MSLIQNIIPILIYFITPLLGLILYVFLIKKMENTNLEYIPKGEYFAIFFVYGGILLIVLTELFWEWSGLASLGSFFLISVAPIILGIITLNLYKKRMNSKYNLWAFRLSVLYVLIALTALITIIINLINK